MNNATMILEELKMARDLAADGLTKLAHECVDTAHDLHSRAAYPSVDLAASTFNLIETTRRVVDRSA